MNGTIKLPGIIGIEIKIRDDVWMAGQEGGLAVEEMDDELFISRVKSEAGWEIEVMITHERMRKEKEKANEMKTMMYIVVEWWGVVEFVIERVGL